MENRTTAPTFFELIESRIGIVGIRELSTEYLAKEIEKTLENLEYVKAILLSHIVFRRTNDYSQIITTIIRVTNSTTTEVLKLNYTGDEQDIIRDSLHVSCVDWKTFYIRFISHCITCPKSIGLRIYSLVYHEVFRNTPECDDSSKALLSELEGLFFQEQISIRSIQKILLHSPYKWFEREQTKVSFGLLLKEYSRIVDQDHLVALWVFHQYLGNNTIVNIITEILLSKGVDLEKTYHDFLVDPVWPWYSRELLEERYKKLSDKFSGKKLENAHTLLTSLQNASPITLIPTILYARHRNNCQIELLLLWYVSKNSKSFPSVFSKLEEANGGFPIPEGYLSTGYENRGAWFDRRMQQCKAYDAFSKRNITRTVRSLKECFPLQPLHPILLGKMLEVDKGCFEENFSKMFMTSIHKLDSPIVLAKLLITAACFQQKTAVRAVLLQLVIHGNQGSILFAAEEILKEFRMSRNFLLLDTVGDILEVCNVFTPSVSEWHRYTSIHEEFQSFHRQANQFFTFHQQDLLKEEMLALQLFKAARYQDLLDLVRKDSFRSEEVLDIALQASLLHGKMDEILVLYQKLAEKNYERAVYYNSDVEIYFRIKNIHQKQGPTKGLTSAVWGIPIYLENPINGLARKVAFSHK